MPPAWIGKLNMKSRPFCRPLRSPNIAPYRLDDGDHNFRTKLIKLAGQERFTHLAGRMPQMRFHAIDRFAAQVNQVTPQRAKRVKKLSICGPQPGQGSHKCVANSPVQPRICLIEKSTRSRRSFTHEQYAYAPRAIFPAQALSRPQSRAVFWGTPWSVAWHSRLSGVAIVPRSNLSNHLALPQSKVSF